MIGDAGLDAHSADVKTALVKLLNPDIGGHFAQADREERAFHLAGEDIIQSVARAFVSENAQLVVRVVNGQKKWQTLDVVPMRVGEQQGEVQRLIAELGHQLAPKQPQTSARIKNNDLTIGADFDAGIITAVLDSGRAGSCD